MATAMRVVSEADFQLLQEIKGETVKVDSKVTREIKDVNPSKLVLGEIKKRLDSLITHMDLPNEPLMWKAWKLGKALLESKKFEWDEDGHIRYDGKIDATSNIVDLIKNLVLLDQDYQVSNPKNLPGANLFFAALNEPNVKRNVSARMMKNINKM